MAHIMVVEDEPITAADLEQTLLNMGHELSGWSDTGEEAVEQAKKLAPDLVLMDIRLRGAMTGIEAAERIREDADVPVVFLTAFADRDTVDRACGTHPYGYLVKPFTERTVAAAVQTALSRVEDERRTRERERWVSSVLRSLGEALVALDDDGTIRFVNSLAAELLQAGERELLGKRASAAFRLSDPDRADGKDAVEMALCDGHVTSSPGGALLERADGSKVLVAYSAAPMLGARGQRNGAVLVFREAPRPEAATGADRSEAVASLARRLQHEINSPLTYNLGALSLARRELDALRAFSAVRDASALPTARDVREQEERLRRIDRLLLAAHEGATRVASVMGDLRATSPSGAEVTALTPEELLDIAPLSASATLPRAAERDHAARRGSVLVVDDEPMIGRVLEIALQREHDVTSVHSAESALTLLERGDAFDVILCDLSMPGMGGREFYERLRSTRPEIAARIVFMSGGARSAEDARFLSSMASRRLDKPFRTDELAPLIAQRIAEREPERPPT